MRTTPSPHTKISAARSDFFMEPFVAAHADRPLHAKRSPGCDPPGRGLDRGEAPRHPIARLPRRGCATQKVENGRNPISAACICGRIRPMFDLRFRGCGVAELLECEQGCLEYQIRSGFPLFLGFRHVSTFMSHTPRRVREWRSEPACYDSYLSGSGLRATGGCKPRQVRKEATVAV